MCCILQVQIPKIWGCFNTPKHPLVYDLAYPELPQSETNFAVSSAPLTYIHWGVRGERELWGMSSLVPRLPPVYVERSLGTTLGNVNINNHSPNQNHGRILISYQEYHKCNTWCHNVYTIVTTDNETCWCFTTSSLQYLVRPDKAQLV